MRDGSVLAFVVLMLQGTRKLSSCTGVEKMHILAVFLTIHNGTVPRVVVVVLGVTQITTALAKKKLNGRLPPRVALVNQSIELID